MRRAFWKGWVAGLATVAAVAYADELQTRFSIIHMKWRDSYRMPVVFASVGTNTINIHTRHGIGVRYRRTSLDRIRPPLPRSMWPKPVQLSEDEPSAVQPVCSCSTDAWEPHEHCWLHDGRCCHCPCPARSR